jgi:hypothetical protein
LGQNENAYRSDVLGHDGALFWQQAKLGFFEQGWAVLNFSFAPKVNAPTGW